MVAPRLRGATTGPAPRRDAIHNGRRCHRTIRVIAPSPAPGGGTPRTGRNHRLLCGTPPGSGTFANGQSSMEAFLRAFANGRSSMEAFSEQLPMVNPRWKPSFGLLPIQNPPWKPSSGDPPIQNPPWKPSSGDGLYRILRGSLPQAIRQPKILRGSLLASKSGDRLDIAGKGHRHADHATQGSTSSSFPAE